MSRIIPVEKNKEYKLEIESISSQGQGIGRVNGFAVFVPFTAQGDLARVRVVKVKSNYAFGILTEIIKPSPDRCTPVCAHAKKCGGCQLMHIQYEKQLAFKQKGIQDALKRIGGVDVAVQPVLGMDEPFRYRNKMVFPVGKGRSGETICGFYRERSHDIVPIGDCMLGNAGNAAIVQAVLQYMEENGVAPYDEHTHTGVVRRIFTRWSKAVGEIMVVVSVNAKYIKNPDRLTELLRLTSDKITSIILNVNRDRTNLVLGPENKVLYGKGAISDRLCGLWFDISPHSFFQVNPAQTEKLYLSALELAAFRGTETVFDIYCGIGTISLLAAQKAKRVIGVEIVPQAIENARVNAQRNGICNAEFYAADAKDIVPALIAEGVRPDVVLLDPPRKGSDEATLSAIVRSGAEKVIYISCNPATLARDVRILCNAGYAVKTALGVDLFPWTHHVETVVMLSHKE